MDDMSRTKGEKHAYVEGYNNCFKQFLKYLNEKDVEKAVKDMKVIVDLVNYSLEIDYDEDSDVQY